MENKWTNQCFAAAFPPDSWGRMQDKYINQLAEIGLEWSDWIEFFHRSDGNGSIFYGVNWNPALAREIQKRVDLARQCRICKRYEEQSGRNAPRLSDMPSFIAHCEKSHTGELFSQEERAQEWRTIGSFLQNLGEVGA